MQRKAKTVTTKDGYIIKKHTTTLTKGRFYTIEKDSVNKGWYTYKELNNALTILRVMSNKNIEFAIHNKREVVLLQSIQSECNLVKAYPDEYAINKINKINGMLSACFMLDMLLEPIIIITLDDVIELRRILQYYLNIYYQQQGIKKILNKGDKNHERKWYPCTNWRYS